jgi:hypothetical protein
MSEASTSVLLLRAIAEEPVVTKNELRAAIHAILDSVAFFEYGELVLKDAELAYRIGSVTKS